MAETQRPLLKASCFWGSPLTHVAGCPSFLFVYISNLLKRVPFLWFFLFGTGRSSSIHFQEKMEDTFISSTFPFFELWAFAPAPMSALPHTHNTLLYDLLVCCAYMLMPGVGNTLNHYYFFLSCMDLLPATASPVPLEYTWFSSACHFGPCSPISTSDSPLQTEMEAGRERIIFDCKRLQTCHPETRRTSLGPDQDLKMSGRIPRILSSVNLVHLILFWSPFIWLSFFFLNRCFTRFILY